MTRNRGRRGGADGGAVVDAEQDAHFPDQRAGLIDGGDVDAVAHDDQLALLQHIELAARLAGG